MSIGGPHEVLPPHALQLFADTRPARVSGSTLPRPVPAPRRAVPADDRLRLHHHQGGTPAGPIPREPRPEETVGWLRSSASALTGQHGELLRSRRAAPASVRRWFGAT